MRRVFTDDGSSHRNGARRISNSLSMASTPNRRSRPPGPRDPEQGTKGEREPTPSSPPPRPSSGLFAATTAVSPSHGSGMHRLGTLPPPAHETLILGFTVPKERV